MTSHGRRFHYGIAVLILTAGCCTGSHHPGATRYALPATLRPRTLQAPADCSNPCGYLKFAPYSFEVRNPSSLRVAVRCSYTAVDASGSVLGTGGFWPDPDGIFLEPGGLFRGEGHVSLTRPAFADRYVVSCSGTPSHSRGGAP